MRLLLNVRCRTEGHLPRIGGEQQRVVCYEDLFEDEIHVLLKYFRLSSTLISV